MAALLMAFFFCLLPQLYLHPAAQRCLVTLPVPNLSRSQPLLSYFPYAYLVSFYGRRRAAAVEPAEEEGDAAHKMREACFVRRFCKRRSRSSELSIRDKSWCFRRPSHGGHLMLLFLSLAVLLLLSAPSVLGTSELLRVGGHGAYSDNWHRGNKGTNVFSQLQGVNGRPYKHGEPPPADIDGAIVDKFHDDPVPEGGDLTSSSLNAHVRESFTVNSGKEGDRESGEGDAPKPAARNLERLRFGSLIRDCLRVKCSPLDTFELKPPLLDDISRVGSPGFQGSALSAPNVAINPPFLEWGSQPMFAPAVASLSVVNNCNSTRLKVFQPFSTDVQFYALAFEERVVDPGDMISIPVVFLPRALGAAEAILIVQTTAGGFLVQAQGKGIVSPYKAQPLQGLKVTTGETLQYTVTLHNPHDEVLRVSEVYAWPSKFAESSLSDSNAGVRRDPCNKEVATSSGVSSCADTPNGGAPRLFIEASKLIEGGAATVQMRPSGELEIGPHSSNAIAEFEFAAVSADKYSGSLHIKLSREAQASQELLILPIDVQVSEPRKAYLPLEPVFDVLEFGILTKEDQTSRVDLILHNPGTEAVWLKEVSPLLEDKNIVDIEYKKGLVLPPDSETEVAAITYAGIEETVPSNFSQCHPIQFPGDRMLVVITNSSVRPRLEVPYRALVIHGSADCDPAQSSVGVLSGRSDVTRSAGIAGLERAVVRGHRVHFSNDLSVPLHLFMDLELMARTTNTHLPLSVFTHDSVCCHESSGGRSAVDEGQLSVSVHSELVYPLVQIGTEEVQWVNVSNPTEKPLHVYVLMSPTSAANHRACQNEGLSLEQPGAGLQMAGSPCFQGGCDFIDNQSNVFSFAEGATVEAVVEPLGTAALGPVVFSPPERCSWTGLLSLWNNLTQVEWVPLYGSGGSASLTILDGEYPIDLLQLEYNVTQVDMTSEVEEVAGLFDARKKATKICSQRVSRGFWAKNTGDIDLDVTAVELVGGGCSAYGFEVGSCNGFTLAPGESEELYVSFQPDFAAGVFQKGVNLITSVGIVEIPLFTNLPEHLFPLCTERTQPTNLERAFLYPAIVALVVVLGVFFRMLLQEMSLPQKQLPGNASRVFPQPKTAARQGDPIFFSTTNGLAVTKANNSSSASGRLKCSSGEPEVQLRTGEESKASGPGRPKESMKVLVRAFKGVADSITGTLGSTSTTLSGESNEDMGPPPGLPGLRVKIPSSTAFSAQKSNLGSPLRKASSPASSHFRKGMADKRNQIVKLDGLQGKLAPEPAEEDLNSQSKQSTLPESPKPAVKMDSLIFTKEDVDGYRSQQSCQRTGIPPSISSVVTGSPVLYSPRKGSQFTQIKQVFSPKAQPLSPQSQPSGVHDKDKGKKKKRRGNHVGSMKRESVSKGRSGSSSPSSSPASPATPASPRPLSPLLHADLQPSMPAPSLGFPNARDSRGASMVAVTPLSKLDVTVTQQGAIIEPDIRKESSGPRSYRNDRISVDIASTALREMAQAKATDLNWSTLSGKGNRSMESSKGDSNSGRRRVPKDSIPVARKAMIESALVGKPEVLGDDSKWETKSWGMCGGPEATCGPALKPSATFPRRHDCGSEWTFGADSEVQLEALNPLGCSSAFVPASTMPPAARAPGAKIAKPHPDVSQREIGWGARGEYSPEGSTSWGDVYDKKNDASQTSSPGLCAEDQRFYDIWGNHFAEIRASTHFVRSGAADGAVSSLPMLTASPSFFSSFPQPSFPSMDTQAPNRALSGPTSGFSVFSQAPDSETFGISSAVFNNSTTEHSRQFYPGISADSNFGQAKISENEPGGGASLPGSLRKPRVPYTPPLGPSSMGSEFPPPAVSEAGSDPSCSFWSGGILQEAVTTAIHSPG